MKSLVTHIRAPALSLRKIRSEGPIVPCEPFMKTYRQYAGVFDDVGRRLSQELRLTRTKHDMVGYSLERPMTEGRCRTSRGENTGIERLVELSVRAPESNQALFRSIVHVRPNSHTPDLTLSASVEPGVESSIMFQMAPENGAVDEALHRFLVEIQEWAIPMASAYDDIRMTGRIGFRFPDPDLQLPQFEKMALSFSREWLIAFKRQRATHSRLGRRELMGSSRMDDKEFLEKYLGLYEGRRLYRELWNENEQ